MRPDGRRYAPVRRGGSSRYPESVYKVAAAPGTDIVILRDEYAQEELILTRAEFAGAFAPARDNPCHIHTLW